MLNNSRKKHTGVQLEVNQRFVLIDVLHDHLKISEMIKLKLPGMNLVNFKRVSTFERPVIFISFFIQNP